MGLLKDKGEEIGYRVLIIPSPTFLKGIVKENKFNPSLAWPVTKT